MKKITAFLLALCFTFSLTLISASAASTHKFKETVSGTVISVLDGDSFLFQADDGRLGYVHFAGITTASYDAALAYVTSELLGARVSLVYDAALSGLSDRWNYMYVFKNNVSINELLLSNGFAKMANDQKSALAFSALAKAEIEGKSKKVGLWAESFYNGGSQYTVRTVNLNLTKAADISNMLIDVPLDVSQNIVKYRENAPFRKISDVKFVKGFTKEMYDKNSYQLSVCTDLNSATLEELASLRGMDTALATKIITYRVMKSFSDIQDLKKNGLLSSSQYDQIKNYISVVYQDTIDLAIPDVRVNINTASLGQLMDTGLTNSQAQQIIDNRRNGYSFKNLGELGNFKNSYFTLDKINAFSDNFTVMTDINSASSKEIRSLFANVANASKMADDLISHRPYKTVAYLEYVIGESNYEKIKPYVYVDSYETDFRNINLTSESELVLGGFTAFQVKDLANKAKKMYSPADIPIDISGRDHRATLYTNINTASKNELSCLSNLMTEKIVDYIISYRKDQPFGSIEEIEAFFKANVMSSVFNEIKEFLVVR